MQCVPQRGAMFIETNFLRGRTPAGCNVHRSLSLHWATAAHSTPLGCALHSRVLYKHCTPLGCGRLRTSSL
jgi:hypothetical protein